MNYIYMLNHELELYKYWCIYGSGVAAVELCMMIIEQGGHVDFFCDFDDFCVGKFLLNKRIISVGETARMGSNVCVIVCKEYMPSIMKRLQEFKIRNIFVQNSEDDVM